MSRPRIASLCSGVGGLDLAVESVIPDAELAWYAQYEPPDKKGKPDTHQYAAQIMAHRFPGVPNLGDITAIDYAGVEPADILTSGSPCTDISLAGQREGMMPGTRSGIWSHVTRAIAALRPSIVLIENVRSLTSARAHSSVEWCPGCMGDPGDGSRPPVAMRALGRVLGDLAGLGFDAEWASIRASDIGGCHPRARTFVLAWPAAENPDIAAGGERRLAAPGQAEGGRPRADAGGRSGAPAADADREPVWVEPVAGPGGGGATVAELAGPDAPNPEGAGLEARRQGRPGGGPAADADGRGLPGQPEPDREPEEPQADDQHDPDGPVLAWGDYGPAIERWEHALGRPAPRATDGRGRLDPCFVEWMVGLPAGWVTEVPGIPRNAQLHALGNIAMPQQAARALRELLWRAST